MNHFSDVHYSILRLLTECGWVSPSLLEVAGYSYTYRARSLKSLLDLQYIRKLGEGQARAYALAPKGRNHLAGLNASRFRDEVMAHNRRLTHNADDRVVLRGNAAAFLSVAGYAVHLDDKPAFPAYTPDISENPVREDWARLYQNARLIQYPGVQDKTTYTQRLTPMGCYYDAAQIKELLRERGRDGASVRYSRACGVLMTPSFLFRVFHSRDVAMKFQLTGERNLHDLLLTGQVFQGYLPERHNAVLIFGTDFTAARHILGHQMDGQSARMPVYAKRRGGKGYAEVKGTTGEMLTPTNLGNPAFYLPLIPESQPLLRLMRYPFWQEEMVRQICREMFKREDQSRWQFEMEDGVVFILAALNLTQISLALRAIKSSVGKKAWIICLHWQEPLFRELLEPFSQHSEIRITRLPAAYMESLINRFELYWGGGQ